MSGAGRALTSHGDSPGPFQDRGRGVRVGLVPAHTDRLQWLDLLRAERQVCQEHLLRRATRERTGEKKTLGVRAPEALQLARLVVALDTFGDYAGIECSRQSQDALDDGGTVGKHQALHERP